MLKTFHLTQENLRKGIRSNKYSCAIALALTEGGLCNVEVRAVSATMQDRDGYTVYVDLPSAVISFIAKFDSHCTDLHSLSPFDFQIDLPDRVL